jgi:hypothetical protein
MADYLSLWPEGLRTNDQRSVEVVYGSHGERVRTSQDRQTTPETSSGSVPTPICAAR